MLNVAPAWMHNVIMLKHSTYFYQLTVINSRFQSAYQFHFIFESRSNAFIFKIVLFAVRIVFLCIMIIIIIWSLLMPVLFPSFFLHSIQYFLSCAPNAAHFIMSFFFFYFVHCVQRNEAKTFICSLLYASWGHFFLILFYSSPVSFHFLCFAHDFPSWYGNVNVFSCLFISRSHFLWFHSYVETFLILSVHFAFRVLQGPLALDIFLWECARRITAPIIPSIIFARHTEHTSEDRGKNCSFFFYSADFFSYRQLFCCFYCRFVGVVGCCWLAAYSPVHFIVWLGLWTSNDITKNLCNVNVFYCLVCWCRCHFIRTITGVTCCIKIIYIIIFFFCCCHTLN